MERPVILLLSGLLVAASLDLASTHLGLALLYGLVGLACFLNYAWIKPWNDRMLSSLKIERTDHDRMLAKYRRQSAKFMREAKRRGIL